MKSKLIAACGIAASCLSAPAFAQTAPADAVAATPAAPVMAQPLPQVGAGSALPSNTDVWLTLDRKLDSHDVKLGDALTFKVARDVMLGNFIIIPRGTPANGRITYRTGRGAYVDMALLDTQVAVLGNQALNWMISGQVPRRMGNGHANLVPYQSFDTADGPVIVAVGNDRQFERLCAILGLPSLAQDERFRTNPARVTNRAELHPFPSGPSARR